MPTLPSARLVATVVALGAVTVAGQAALSGSSSTYVVQAGDSLWAISRRSGVTMQQLAAANHMQLSDVLFIGRHLVLPGHRAAPGTTASAAATSAAATSATSAGATAGDFCATFTPTAGPRGVLPPGMTSSHLALRPLLVRWAAAYGVRPSLLEAIAWQESGWQQGVVSSAQAVGVGQLLPTTADFVGHQLLGTTLDLTSTSDNIRMMARYVAYLQSFEHSTCRTVAAYYEGPQNMARYGVFTETRPYVTNVEYLEPRFS